MILPLRDFTRAVLAFRTGDVADLLIVREGKERKVKVDITGWAERRSGRIHDSLDGAAAVGCGAAA
jgi:hypothetical protein